MSDPDLPDAYFHRTAAGFMPTQAASSPWDNSKLSGVGMGGLLAQVIAETIDGLPMTVARLTIDILGTAPLDETVARVRTVRAGRRLHLIEAEIGDEGRPAARATAMLVREAQTPRWQTALAHPLPEDVPPIAGSSRPAIAHAGERRIVYGKPQEPGPGAMWFRTKIPFIAGRATPPLVRAAMLGDMGSAIGSTIPVRDYSFANTDIALHFTRMPQADWLLIESLVESAGNGMAIASSSFADRQGIYARGHQVLFVDPRQRG